MAQQQISSPKLDLSNPMLALSSAQEAVNGWARRQHPGVEVALATFTGGFQGACLGGLMGWISTLDPEAAKANGANKMALGQGGPAVQARNFAVMTGVNSGISLAVKKYRKGGEDVQTAMIAALGSGAAFSLVSGINPPGSNPVVAALATGMSFAVLQGAFFKVGEMFGGGKAKTAEQDVHYLRAKHLLQTLGLPQYEKNLRKGQLTDNTIMLWNDSALQEVKVPPGPRLLILHHIEQYRHLLKPAMPVPGAPGGK